jgi:hypothetical protein
VKTALVHGIQVIFFAGAVVMSCAILVNVFLREVPLQKVMKVEADIG